MNFQDFIFRKWDEVTQEYKHFDYSEHDSGLVLRQFGQIWNRIVTIHTEA